MKKTFIPAYIIIGVQKLDFSPLFFEGTQLKTSEKNMKAAISELLSYQKWMADIL